MGLATSREDAAAAEDDEEDSGLDLQVPPMVLVSNVLHLTWYVQR